jgi:acylphosphatase
MKHFNITVLGKVQGVFYRASTKAQADLLGVKGFVQNESNGDVYIEAEADEKIMHHFLEWCKQGPSRARVDELKTEEAALKKFSTFEVRK